MIIEIVVGVLLGTLVSAFYIVEIWKSTKLLSLMLLPLLMALISLLVLAFTFAVLGIINWSLLGYVLSWGGTVLCMILWTRLRRNLRGE